MFKHGSKGRKSFRKSAYPVLKLLKRHNKVYLRAIGFIETTAAISLRLFAEAALKELTSALERTGALAQSEYINNAYLRVIDAYNKITVYYNTHNEEIDEQGKTMLAGIRAIFYTRLSEYKEVRTVPCIKTKQKFDDECLLNFSGKVREAILSKLRKVPAGLFEKHSPRMWAMVPPHAVMEDISLDTVNAFSADVFEVYKLFLHKARDSEKALWDDIELNLRRLRHEYDMLSVIVKVQVPELEAYSETYGPVNRIVDMLRSEFEALSASLSHIEAACNQRIHITDEAADDFAVFTDRVLTHLRATDALTLNMDKFESEYVFILDNYDESVKAYLKEQYKNRVGHSHKHLKAERQLVSHTEALCLSITKELDRALHGISEAIELCEEDPAIHQVILGIHETLCVKLSAIRDMQGEYSENIKPLLEREAPLAYSLTDKDTEEALNRYKLEFNGFFEDYKTSLKQVERFYKRQIEKAKAKNSLALKKRLEDEADKIRKTDFKFKKECLFFEIVTFEEIITYSVLKLDGSGNAAALRCSSLIHTAAFNIKNIVEKYGIETIEPAVGDMFNGRLHEVIMAKEEEGFARGEISKVISKGYKEGAMVFARANVICAK